MYVCMYVFMFIHMGMCICARAHVFVVYAWM